MRILQDMGRIRAFTLVELVVIVLILGTLAFVVIPRVSQSADTAKQRTCETNIRLLDSAIERYHATHGTWPTGLWVITKDKDLFPDGSPKCPITGTDYSELSDDHRVKRSDHNHEQTPQSTTGGGWYDGLRSLMSSWW